MSTLIWAGLRSIPEIVNSRLVVLVLRSLIICPNFPKFFKTYHWEYWINFLPLCGVFLLPPFFWVLTVFHLISCAWVRRSCAPLLLSASSVFPPRFSSLTLSAFWCGAFTRPLLYWARSYHRFSLDEASHLIPYLKLIINLNAPTLYNPHSLLRFLVIRLS